MAYSADQLLTSRAEVEKLLTRLGVTARVDDEAPEDTEIIDYYVNWATGEVHYYLAHAASIENLATVSWVRDQATLCAAFYFTTHGGEPGNSSLGALWEKAEEKLERIRTEKADVPGLLLDTGKGGSPIVSNLVVDMRRQPAIRVNRPSSTGVPSGYPVANDVPGNIRGRS